MRILLTGGTGAVGRMAVARLVRNGHQVRVIGRRTGVTIEGAEYIPCDINDYASLCKLTRGMQGIIHLAAIPNPALGSGHEIFRVNCAGTFNVYHAAAEEGIKRVVQASSINALGYNFGIVGFPLRYFPIDEEHPSFTTDPYSFSKQIVEEIADYFWRREGISGVSLRLPMVYEVEEDAPGSMEETRGWIEQIIATHRAIIGLPGAERTARVQALMARFEALRTSRIWEKPYDQQGDWSDPETGVLFGRSNFWTSVDARDSAQALEKGLLADYRGSHALFINDAYNFTGLDSRTLAEVFFPDVTTWKRPVQGSECLVSIDKARRLIGYEPEYTLGRLL